MNGTIALIGMAGCGKTAIGREAAGLLGRPFIDLDSLIERQFGPIPELFRLGEAHFRACESNALAGACATPGAVIATGGGIVTVPENMELLARAGIVVFIDRPIDRIVADIDLSTRPLYVCGIEAVHKTYVKRLPLYRQYADYTLENTGSVADACRKLADIIKGGRP